MKKMIILTLVFLMTFQVSAAKRLPSKISKTVNESGINKSAISISVKSIDKTKISYKLNEEKPMPPASTQKIVTFFPSLSVLGRDYEFNTKLYKTANSEYHLVLGADPYLTTYDLKTLTGAISMPKETPIKNFYIDDFLFDREEWGEGWQWDDDLNPLMPKFSIYNLDRNLLKVYVMASCLGSPVRIVTDEFYPVTFMNTAVTGKVNDIQISRRNYISPDLVLVEGRIKEDYSTFIPINHMGRYFILRLEDSLKSHNLSYYKEFKKKKITDKSVLISEIKHPIKDAETDIIKSSNNMVAETVFKLAGAEYSGKKGAFGESLQMFYDYCADNGLNADNIKIADGSGVSKNNLMTTDFMTDFLVHVAKKYQIQTVKEIFPTAGEGTLANRMLYFKDKIYAKTGTLSDVSAMAGYIETKKGNIYAFSIMINDAKSKAYEKKIFEEQFLRAIYNEL